MNKKNKIIKSNKRYLSKNSWLKSYHLFSFAEYYDSTNSNFGNLRVFNDDYIKANSGFGLHPHSNMEILTIVLDGTITHGDNIGNKKSIHAGEIQTMTTGSGIFHSEENIGEVELHIFQIWFLSNKNGLTPSYKNHKINLKNNNLNLLVSGNKDDNVGFLNSSIEVFRGKYSNNQKFIYEINDNKGLFIYLYKGCLQIGDEIIEEGDQIRYSQIGEYNIKSLANDTDFILINVEI